MEPYVSLPNEYAKQQNAASRQSRSKALLDEIRQAAVVQQQIGQGEYEVGNVAKSEWHKGKAAGMREVLAMIVHSSNVTEQARCKASPASAGSALDRKGD